MTTKTENRSAQWSELKPAKLRAVKGPRLLYCFALIMTLLAGLAIGRESVRWLDYPEQKKVFNFDVKLPDSGRIPPTPHIRNVPDFD